MSGGGCGRCLIVLVSMALLAATAAFFVTQCLLILRTGAFFYSVPMIVITTVILGYMLIFLFGCLAACCDHRVMLYVYTFAMICLLALIIYVFIFYNLPYHDHANIEKDLGALYDRYKSESSSRRLVDDIQNYFKCCGFKSFMDKVPQTDGNTDHISCCNSQELVSKNVTLTSVNVRTSLDPEQPENITLKLYKPMYNYDYFTSKRNISRATLASCPASAAKNSHPDACLDKLNYYEPFIFYAMIIVMVLTTFSILSGILSAFECGEDGHSIHFRTSRRR